MNQLCSHCNIKFWLQKKEYKSSQVSSILMICYVSSKIYLLPLLEPLTYLLNLYTLSAFNADSFYKNIRAYNNILICISFDANID